PAGGGGARGGVVLRRAAGLDATGTACTRRPVARGRAPRGSGRSLPGRPGPTSQQRLVVAGTEAVAGEAGPDCRGGGARPARQAGGVAGRRKAGRELLLPS